MNVGGIKRNNTAQIDYYQNRSNFTSRETIQERNNF